jgi:RimJ/RimL family protein N-acetyltransferase
MPSSGPPGAPLLTTERLDLRPLAAADVDAAHALWTDPGVRRYLWDDIVIPRERAQAVIAESERNFRDHGFGLWGVRERGKPALLGFCGFRKGDLMVEPELLCGFLPAYWGKGLAAEAARAALEFGFQRLGLTAVGAATDAPNTASIRVIERLGMTFVRRDTVNGLDTVFYRLQKP